MFLAIDFLFIYLIEYTYLCSARLAFIPYPESPNVGINKIVPATAAPTFVFNFDKFWYSYWVTDSPLILRLPVVLFFKFIEKFSLNLFVIYRVVLSLFILAVVYL